MQRGGRPPFYRARLRADPTYRIELEYATEIGLPWSEYLERFSEEDRNRVLALKMEQSTRCTSCGTAEWEWEDDPAAYEAAVKVCLGCMHKDLKREDRRNNGNKPGETITLVPKGHTVKDPRPRLKPRTRSRSQ